MTPEFISVHVKFYKELYYLLKRINRLTLVIDESDLSTVNHHRTRA